MITDLPYNDLPFPVKADVQIALYKHFKSYFKIDDAGNVCSKSGMRYGYVTCSSNEVLVCDCTGDEGDVLIATIRY